MQDFITQSDVQEAVTDSFRAAVGQGKPHSVCAIATDTGKADSYWMQVRSGSKTPSLVATLQAAQAMGDQGPAFLDGILRAAGFTGVRQVDTVEGCPHKVTGKLSRAITLMAEALEDGNFDARERFQVAEALRDLARDADAIERPLKVVGR